MCSVTLILIQVVFSKVKFAVLFQPSMQLIHWNVDKVIVG